MYYDQLKSMDLFQNVSPETIERINQMPIHQQTFEENELVAEFLDPLKYIFVVLDGVLKTNEYTLEGKEIVSSYYEGYEAFPFYLIYSGANVLPYNVYCHRKAQVMFLPSKEIMDCVAQDILFMDNVLRFVSKYCNYNKQVIRTVSYTRINQRIAFWLLTSSNSDLVYKLPGTQEVFADILHTNRSTLNQELKFLRDEGTIRFNRKKIKILDPDKLRLLIEK